MRRIKSILVMIMAIICLVGCGKYEAAMQVNEDGTGSIAVLYAINPDKMRENGMDPSKYNMDSITEELEDRGFTVEDYNENGCEGFVVSAANVDLNQAFNNMCVEGSGMELVGFNPGNFQFNRSGNECTIDWYFYNTDSTSTEKIEVMRQSIEGAGGTARVTMYFPSEPIEHDAPMTSDGGTVLQWNILDLGSDQSLHVRYRTDGSSSAAPQGQGGGQGGSQGGGQGGSQGGTGSSGSQGNQGGGTIISLGLILQILGAAAVAGTGFYLYFTYRKREKIAEMYEDYNGGIVNPLNMNKMGIQPQQFSNGPQMPGMGQKQTGFGGPAGMNGMNNTMNNGMPGMNGQMGGMNASSPMGMNAGMGNNAGMQNNQWSPRMNQQTVMGGMNQMNGMNQNQPTGAAWTPQGAQPMQQMPGMQAQATDFAQSAPSATTTPDWGVNN